MGMLKASVDWTTHERLLAGLRGWHVALCALELDATGEYLGYYKIFAQAPESYWEAQGLIKGCTDLPRATPWQALADAEEQARLAVYNLPAPHALQAVARSRALNIYELHQLGSIRCRRRF